MGIVHYITEEQQSKVFKNKDERTKKLVYFVNDNL